MSRTIITTLQVPTPATPRGAIWASDFYAWVANVFRSSSAGRVPSHAEEAAAVRELAQSVQHKQPGFASDLFAAAARHESKDD